MTTDSQIPDRDDVIIIPGPPGPPRLSGSHGAYAVSWNGSIAVDIAFDLLRYERRTGETSAEIAVRRGGVPLRRGTRLNLSSSRGRNELAKDLGARAAGEGLDWIQLLEDACIRVLDAHRAGEPAILLREAEDPPEAGWVLPPLALRDDPVILFGDGGTMKSYLLLAAACDIHTGSQLLGLPASERRRTLYVDWEWSPAQHKLRLRQLVGMEMPDIIYVRCEAPLREEVNRLIKVVRDNAIEFAVFDSAGFGCEGPPEEAQAALGFFEALRRLHVGALISAHVNRSGDTERPFGSAFWHNSARATWYVKKQQEVGAAGVAIGLFNKKSNAGPLARPLGFTFTFDQDRTTIRRGDVHDVPEMADQLSVKDRMAHALRGGARTYEELAELLEVSIDTVRRTALRGTGRGVFLVLDGTDKRKRVALRTHPDRSPDTVPDNPGHVRSDKTGGPDTGAPTYVVGSPLSDPVVPARSGEREEERCPRCGLPCQPTGNGLTCPRCSGIAAKAGTAV